MRLKRSVKIIEDVLVVGSDALVDGEAELFLKLFVPVLARCQQRRQNIGRKHVIIIKRKRQDEFRSDKGKGFAADGEWREARAGEMTLKMEGIKAKRAVLSIRSKTSYNSSINNASFGGWLRGQYLINDWTN
jgi:hypothetical protein